MVNIPCVYGQHSDGEPISGEDAVTSADAGTSEDANAWYMHLKISAFLWTAFTIVIGLSLCNAKIKTHRGYITFDGELPDLVKDIFRAISRCLVRIIDPYPLSDPSISSTIEHGGDLPVTLQTSAQANSQPDSDQATDDPPV